MCFNVYSIFSPSKRKGKTFSCTFSRMQKPYYEKTSSWLSFGICGKKEIRKYLQKRRRPTQNFSTMLFTKLYLGVNCLIFLLPIGVPPSLQIGKVFCKHHWLYIPFVNFNHQWNCLLLKKKKICDYQSTKVSNNE